MKRFHKDSKKFLTKEQMIEKFGSMAWEEWDKSPEVPSFLDFADCAPNLSTRRDTESMPDFAKIFIPMAQVLHFVNIFDVFCSKLDEAILLDISHQNEAKRARTLLEVVEFGVASINWVASAVNEIGPIARRTVTMPLSDYTTSSRRPIDSIIYNMARHCYLNSDSVGKMDTSVASELSVNLFMLLSYIKTQIQKYGGSMQELMAMSLDGNYSK